MWAWGGEFGFGLAILRSVDSVLCPVRVGRSDEQSAVTALVNRAAEGRGGGAFVLGEPGGRQIAAGAGGVDLCH